MTEKNTKTAIIKPKAWDKKCLHKIKLGYVIGNQEPFVDVQI
jgi:hypothetical protein